MGEYLSLKQYSDTQQAATEKLPNRVVESFRPVAFAKVGYPITINNPDELWKYADTMHELRHNSDLAGFHEGFLTPSEFAIFRTALAGVSDFLSSRFQRRDILPIDAGMRALYMYRKIAALSAGRPLTILEMGPGSGLLGSMLLQTGFRYLSTEVTDAFYLYQSHLYRWMSEENQLDFATEGFRFSSNDAWDELQARYRSIQIPWWKWAQLRPPHVPKCDIITSNAMLCEMHEWSLRFFLRVADEMLKDSKLGCIAFNDWGSPIGSPTERVLNILAEYGWGSIIERADLVILTKRDNPNVDHLLATIPDMVQGESEARLSSHLKYDLSELNKMYEQLRIRSSTVGMTDEQFLTFAGVAI